MTWGQSAQESGGIVFIGMDANENAQLNANIESMSRNAEVKYIRFVTWLNALEYEDSSGGVKRFKSIVSR